MGIVPTSRILVLTFALTVLTLNVQAREQKRSAGTDTTAMVRGTVRNNAGLPLAGVTVVANAKIFKADPVGEMVIHDSIPTSDSGTYVFPALELSSPGYKGLETAYFLTFSKAGYRQGYSTNLDHPYHLNPGDTAIFDIHLAKVLDLSVIVAKAVAPESSLAGASVVVNPVHLLPNPSYKIGSVNSKGLCTFTDIDGGDKSITVSSDGYKPVVVYKSMNELAPKDSVRILLEKANPDSMRTLIVKLGNQAPYVTLKDTLVLSAGLESFPLSLLSVSDSGVFTFSNIPDSYTSGILTSGIHSDTATFNGPVTQKIWIFSTGLPIIASHGPESGSVKNNQLLGPVRYYFDGRSRKSFDILGKPRPALFRPADFLSR